MNFASYNDFELIYLFKEGSELALNILYDKYSYLIKKVAKKYYSYGDKLDDLVQEGFIVLDKCIRRFDDRKPILFYTFFLICLKHRFSYLLSRTSYFKEHISFNERMHGELMAQHPIKYSIMAFEDNLDQRIYEECIVEGLSITGFSGKYNISYNKVYYRYKIIINELKKILTI